MSLWAELAGKRKQEMTCFGRALEEGGDILVTDAFLVSHQGDAGSVEADDMALLKLMMDCNEKGIPPDELRCWTHSHPGTGPAATYLSGTDEENIERTMTGPWMVSIVFDSIGGSPYCRIDVRVPRVSIVADLEINHGYLSDEDVKAATEEFKEKARRTAASIREPWKPGKNGYSKKSNGDMVEEWYVYAANLDGEDGKDEEECEVCGGWPERACAECWIDSKDSAVSEMKVIESELKSENRCHWAVQFEDDIDEIGLMVALGEMDEQEAIATLISDYGLSASEAEYEIASRFLSPAKDAVAP
jgi:hypothetical protein